MKKIIVFLSLSISLNVNAQIITTVVGNGTSGYSGDGGQASAAKLNFPTGVTLDAVGNLYIADYNNNRIRKINTAGIITTIAGNGTAGFLGDGGQATNAELYQPNEVIIDAAGNLYIADVFNNRIRKVTTQGIISTVVGNGVFGYSGDGGLATAAELSNASQVVLDATGNMFIADQRNNVIRKVNTTGIISTVVGNGVAAYAGDGGQATACEINYVDGVAIDASGNLYIADQGNSRIRKVNTSGIINTIVGTGLAGYSGDGGQAAIAELFNATTIKIGCGGNLYITDYGNNRIRMVNTAGIITTIVGNGTGAYSGDGGQATAAEINTPVGIALDAACNLYIADASNNVIRKVTNVGQATDIKQVGIQDSEFKISPNPNNGNFIIEPSGATKQILHVYDVNGKVVLNRFVEGKTTIDLGFLHDGVYNLSIISNDIVLNKRLVIVR